MQYITARERDRQTERQRQAGRPAETERQRQTDRFRQIETERVQRPLSEYQYNSAEIIRKINRTPAQNNELFILFVSKTVRTVEEMCSQNELTTVQVLARSQFLWAYFQLVMCSCYTFFNVSGACRLAVSPGI